MRKLKLKTSLLLIVITGIIIFICIFYVTRHIYLKSHHAVPADLIYDAEIPGMPDARVIINPEMFDFSDTLTYRVKDGLKRSFSKDKKTVSLLVLSGGGPDGAFSAGFLSGLTESGQRTQYDIVTGVSTGALIAPAAFIGPTYDSVLKDIYTKVTDKDILGSNIKDLFLGKIPSFFNLKPLRRVLKKAISQELVNAIADEYAKGRQLYVLTTNIDARRVVVWNMGAIASYRTQRSLDLFRNVVVASSSIPAAFPPTRFKVRAGGKSYEELHLDGSVGTQMFGCLLLTEQIKGTAAHGDIFIIKNGKLWEDPGTVQPSLAGIATASLSMLLSNQGYMDLIRIYTLAKDSGVGFNCVFVPQNFHETGSGMFDPEYMTKLFKLGYDKAMTKEPWQKAPMVDENKSL